LDANFDANAVVASRLAPGEILSAIFAPQHSHRSTSGSATHHPRREHATALTAAGLANQLDGRNVARRRKKSPRSPGRAGGGAEPDASLNARGAGEGASPASK
jgi:hypothetical protein